MKPVKAICAIAVVALATLFSAQATVLDANFEETVFATIPSQLTGMDWAPDGSGRLFTTHKGGAVRIIKNGTLLPTPFATISPVFTGGECGLIGFCFDPNFIANGYIYFFVTVSSSEQQILRYTADGDLGTNKTVLVPGLPTLGGNHDGGGIAVGADGKLYWAIGDLGNGTGVDGDLASLAAKVGRANLDGSVPAGNPFVDGLGGNNDFIFARGFRNPFTLTFQPATGELWVNCVGTSYEQVFLVRSSDHAGWNDYENNQPAGFITPRIKYRTNGTDTRTVGTALRTNNIATFITTSTHGFRKGERITLSGVGDSAFNGNVYVASTPTSTTFTAVQAGPNAASSGGTAATLSQGGCVTGGAFYNSTAAPAGYRHNFIYGDLNSGRLMRAVLDSTNGIEWVDYFATGSSQQIDVAVGPDGALYYGNHINAVRRAAFTNYTAQQLVVTPSVVRMFENGMAAVNVRLAAAPANDVTVELTASENADLQITEGSTLTFYPTNWSVPQPVFLNATTDSDSESDLATLTVSAAGVPSESITVHVLDLLQPPELSVISGIEALPIELELQGAIGNTYVLEATTNLVEDWIVISTNQLTTTSTNLVDPESTGLPLRFYRARQVE